MVATGLIRGVSGVASNDIQVSGLVSQEFPGSRWREAILFYLFGIWSDRQSVTYRPKISFGNVVLRLDPNGEYCAYGVAGDDIRDVPSVLEDAHQSVGCAQAEVEIALVRFVKNDRIKVLTITFGLGFLSLWKAQRRGEYGVATWGIPNSWGGLSPV